MKSYDFFITVTFALCVDIVIICYLNTLNVSLPLIFYFALGCIVGLLSGKLFMKGV